MRYLLAILLPPVAVLTCGRPFQAILNFFLTLLFWVPGVLHAVLVVHQHEEDRRADRVVRAIERYGVRA